MKFKFILLFFIAFTLNISEAFSTEFRLSGIVLDSLSESPIENATVQLLSEIVLVKSILSKDDGSFQFLLDKTGNYTLTISHIGYKTQIIPIKIELDSNPLITIKLQIEGVNLNEVAVKANKPLISQKNGEIIYQIEGGIWQNSGNVMSIINRIPILKGRSGSSYLLYGTKVVFLLDGKPIESVGVSLDVVLANIGTNQIDKVEILLSPPPSLARFGSPIVNIKTLKQKENGNLFNLSHGYVRGINNRFNNALKYSMKENNLLLGFSASQSQINQKSVINSDKLADNLKYTDNESLFSKSNLYDFNFSSEYGTKKTGIILLNYDHKNIFNASKATSFGNYQIKNNLESLSLNSNELSKTKQNVASLDYNKVFNKFFNIKSAFQIGEFVTKTNENINLKRIDDLSSFINPWDRNIVFNNFYVENESGFGNWKITEGLNLKNSESTTNFLKNVGTKANSNSTFNYKEDVFSVFTTANYSKAKSNITLGLNLERTDIEGISPLTRQNKNFYSLLPTITYNYQITDSKTLTFAFARGIKRPGYEWLNQQELYKNPYSKEIGGGVLTPTIFNKLSISSTFENGLTLTGIYSNQKNRYSFFPFLNSESIVNYTAFNIENFYYLYYSASFQKYVTKVWYFSSDISGYYSNIRSPNFGLKNSGYSQQFSLSNYFTFKGIGQFGLTSSYNTTDYSDSYQFLPQFSLNFEYSKSIFKRNGNVSLSLSDLSNSLKDRYLYKLSDFSAKDNYKYETRLIKISIGYKLGNNNVKTGSTRNANNESEIDRLK